MAAVEINANYFAIFCIYRSNKAAWNYFCLYFINLRMIDSVDSNHWLHSKRLVRSLNRTSCILSFLDPSMKNKTASILKSTRVGTIPFKQNRRCACPINYPSAYSSKHINSPLENKEYLVSNHDRNGNRVSRTSLYVWLEKMLIKQQIIKNST